MLIGRTGYNTLAAQISSRMDTDADRQLNAYIGYDHSALALASVAGNPGNTPTCGELGCPFYPLANQWWESDNERNYSAGATLRHRIDRATFDVNWSYIYSRGLLNYNAASASAWCIRASSPRWGADFPRILIG